MRSAQFEQALINTQKKYGNLVLEVTQSGVSIRPAKGAPDSATTTPDKFSPRHRKFGRRMLPACRP